MPGPADDLGMPTVALTRQVRRPHDATRAWVLAWLGGPVIGIVNGVTRELVYADRVGELTARQISTASGIGLFAGYFWLLHRRWPLADSRMALRVGGVWLAATVAFEFGFGHYVDGQDWSTLLRDYNLADGHLWPLMLVWVGVGPYVTLRLARRRHEHPA